MRTELVNPIQEQLFQEFLRHQANLTAILGSGALDIRGGTFTVHMDKDGRVRKIERSDQIYVI